MGCIMQCKHSITLIHASHGQSVEYYSYPLAHTLHYLMQVVTRVLQHTLVVAAMPAKEYTTLRDNEVNTTSLPNTSSNRRHTHRE